MHRRMAHCDASNDLATAAAVPSTFFLTAGDFMLTVFVHTWWLIVHTWWLKCAGVQWN